MPFMSFVQHFELPCCKGTIQINCSRRVSYNRPPAAYKSAWQQLKWNRWTGEICSPKLTNVIIEVILWLLYLLLDFTWIFSWSQISWRTPMMHLKCVIQALPLQSGSLCLQCVSSLALPVMLLCQTPVSMWHLVRVQENKSIDQETCSLYKPGVIRWDKQWHFNG